MVRIQNVTQIYIIYLSYKVMIASTYFCNGNSRLYDYSLITNIKPIVQFSKGGN